MKKLQIKTRKMENDPKFSENIDSAIVFFRNTEDRIEVKNLEIINIDVYQNGKLIFSGDKYDFYEQLKK